MACVYILRCADGTLYVGHTDELASRVRDHEEGRGGTYTSRRRPVTLVYSEHHDSSPTAIERERQLKGWTVQKKDALIAGDVVALKRLSKRKRR